MKSSITLANLPTHEQIAVYAHLIWEHEGCADGRDIMHWEEAEAQLIANFIHNAGLSPRGNA